MNIEEENVLHVKNINLKKDFKTSLNHWRHIKKIDKHLERLHTKAIENNSEKYIEEDGKLSIK